MKPLHVEGMGLIGSLIAWRLILDRVPFTWNDIDHPINAWRAGTGCAYPAGQPGSLNDRCYRQWLSWANDAACPEEIQRAPYWVDTVRKLPPHSARCAEIMHHKSMRRLEHDTVHINTQRFVKRIQASLDILRCEYAPPGSRVVRAHGFGPRLHHVLWGWTRLVGLEFDRAVMGDAPCFYVRKNRFQFAYAFPCPGRGLWYAGSHLVSQEHPRLLTDAQCESKFEAWRSVFEECAGGAVTVRPSTVQKTIQGWRPAMDELVSDADRGDYKANPKTRTKWWTPGPNGMLTVHSMATNGFRYFPDVWAQLEELL